MQDILRRRVYYTGDTIFNEGDEGAGAFLVQTGRVEILRNVGGEQTLLGEIGPGGIFGEMALVDDQPRMATAKAAQETVCVTVPKNEFRAKIDTLEPFVGALFRVLVQNIRSLTDQWITPPSDLPELQYDDLQDDPAANTGPDAKPTKSAD